MPGGDPCPPTAQHAIRQAKVLAKNILAAHSGKRRRSFSFTGLGKLGALGHHRAVAELPGAITVEGVTAWLMWRGIYWWKLPGAARKTRVAISWISDMVLPSHPVQLNLGAERGARQAHYEPGELVFQEGDSGDCLYMILAGKVEVIKLLGSEPQSIGTLGPGEYFGEMALLGRQPRSASTKALTELDLLVLPRSDFSALTSGLAQFRGEFEQIANTRAAADAARARADSAHRR
jgi:NADH dehydrogenase